MAVKFKKNRGTLTSMLAVDFRRMFTMRLFYIMSGICLVIPILILVMTTMMDGSVSVNPQTGAETVVEGFDNVWQIIGTVSGGNAAAAMSMTAMYNINLLYFGAAVLTCLFVSEDFKSGYAKNLFTVRAKKSDYIASKIIVCLVSSVLLLLAFFAGAMFGGAAAGLPFELGKLTIVNIVMCLLSKVFLLGIFVPVSVAVSAFAKQKTWLSIVGSCAAGMLLFMMIPMLTPLDATAVGAVMCLAGGGMFCITLGVVGNLILRKRDIL